MENLSKFTYYRNAIAKWTSAYFQIPSKYITFSPAEYALKILAEANKEPVKTFVSLYFESLEILEDLTDSFPRQRRFQHSIKESVKDKVKNDNTIDGYKRVNIIPIRFGLTLTYISGNYKEIDNAISKLFMITKYNKNTHIYLDMDSHKNIPIKIIYEQGSANKDIDTEFGKFSLTASLKVDTNYVIEEKDIPKIQTITLNFKDLENMELLDTTNIP